MKNKQVEVLDKDMEVYRRICLRQDCVRTELKVLCGLQCSVK